MNRKWSADNKSRKIEIDRAYYSENSARIKAYVKDWGQKNKHRLAVYAKNRRSRERAAGTGFTVEEWKGLNQACRGCCLRCGQPKALTADHVIPLSKGGSGNITNIQPLCLECNSAKGTKTTDYRNGFRPKRMQMELFGASPAQTSRSEMGGFVRYGDMVPKNRAISRISAIPIKTVKIIHTGCGIGIPDHFTSAMTPHATKTAIATHTRIPMSPEIPGTTAAERMRAYIPLNRISTAD